MIDNMLPKIKQYFIDKEAQSSTESGEESLEDNTVGISRIILEHSYITFPLEMKSDTSQWVQQKCKFCKSLIFWF